MAKITEVEKTRSRSKKNGKSKGVVSKKRKTRSDKGSVNHSVQQCTECNELMDSGVDKLKTKKEIIQELGFEQTQEDLNIIEESFIKKYNSLNQSKIKIEKQRKILENKINSDII